MSNLLEAISNIASYGEFQLRRLTDSQDNRVTFVGEALEEFVKDAFAGTINCEDVVKRKEIFTQTFSWLGNKRNPPDFILRGGDAGEVKKIERAGNNLVALNSSYPKCSLRSNDPFITKGCKNCEKWKEKNLIYSVGHVKDNTLRSIWFVYGCVYAAQPEIYLRCKEEISEKIRKDSDIELSKTKEIARINRVDPLGITSLRVRGMWQIENPRKVFSYLHNTDNEAKFELVAIIPSRILKSFPTSSQERVSKMDGDPLEVTDVKVDDPNNPARTIGCKLIKYIL